jgi:hypothetical protein
VRSAKREKVHGDTGSVTAETAVVLPAVMLVLAILLWGLAVGSGQIALIDAARSGARMAARGDSIGDIRTAVKSSSSMVTGVSVKTEADAIRVKVDGRVRAFGPLHRLLPELNLHAETVAVREPGLATNRG